MATRSQMLDWKEERHDSTKSPSKAGHFLSRAGADPRAQRCCSVSASSHQYRNLIGAGRTIPRHRPTTRASETHRPGPASSPAADHLAEIGSVPASSGSALRLYVQDYGGPVMRIITRHPDWLSGSSCRTTTPTKSGSRRLGQLAQRVLEATHAGGGSSSNRSGAGNDQTDLPARPRKPGDQPDGWNAGAPRGRTSGASSSTCSTTTAPTYRSTLRGRTSCSSASPGRSFLGARRHLLYREGGEAYLRDYRGPRCQLDSGPS